MINLIYANKFCKDDISKIENYDKAVADTTQTWHLHHRLELTLDGKFAHSKANLIRLGMYYNRPYFELIFLTRAEHNKLHHKGKTVSNDTRKKIAESLKGKMTVVINECKNAYRQYKSKGGTMSWNEFQTNFKENKAT